MNQTQKKIRNNILSMLDFLDRCLGQPDKPNQEMSEIHINEMYSIFANAIEEYGKLVYMKSIIVDADNNSYVVNPASDSIMHAIGIDDDLYHNGDTDT